MPDKAAGYRWQRSDATLAFSKRAQKARSPSVLIAAIRAVLPMPVVSNPQKTRSQKQTGQQECQDIPAKDY